MPSFSKCPARLIAAVVLIVLAVLLAMLALAFSQKPFPSVVGGEPGPPPEGPVPPDAPKGPVPPDAPEGLRVFGVGLNKTGTSSLGRFLRAAGFRLFEDPSARRMREAQEGVVPLAEYYGAFEDWPWPGLYREVAARLPGARFVLTVRASPDEWFDSLRRHAGRTGPTDQRAIAYGHRMPGPASRADHVRRYEEHNRAVAEFFEGTGRLLVLPTSLSDAEKSARLAAFLEMPRLRDLKYPVVNRGRPPRRPPTALAPSPGWGAKTLARLGAKGPDLRMSRDLRRYGFLVPPGADLSNEAAREVSSRFRGRKMYEAAQIRRAIADDTREATTPRFVHVPKTGGTFIIYKYVVNNLSHTRGVPAEVLVCRHPVSRLASAYRFVRQARSFWYADDGAAPYGRHPLAPWCRAHSFSEFVEAVCVAGTLTDRILWPQAEFAPRGAEHVVRFEAMAADLRRLEEAGVLRLSKFPPPPGAGNVSKGPPVEPSPGDVARIEAFYADDFRRFGYPRTAPADSLLAKSVWAAGELRDLLDRHDFVELPPGVLPEVLPGVALRAAKMGRPAALRALLRAGVPPGTATALGSTLLHLAAYHGHAEAARVIAEAGGDRGARNEWGETPAQSAKKHPRIRKMLAP